ncbi:MAG: hypothetical protein HYT47_00580 [Candidatus Vogelbacteria bacterium]|nr:hypothetical protein [Candidatus Vogelbacteria bacterium]
MIKKALFSLLVLLFLVAPLALNAQSAEDIAKLIAQLEQQIAALKQQLAQLQGNQSGAFCYSFEKNLGVGSGGKDVDALHAVLVKEGFSVSPLPVSASTGTSYQEIEFKKSKVTFTEATAAAVSAFQLKYAKEILAPLGLTNPTGYVGPSTRAVLNRLYGCKYVFPSPYPQPSPYPPPYPIPVPIPNPVPAQTLTVVSPNGGEAWQKGTSQLIQWSWNTNTFVGQQFTIYLNPIPTPCPMTTTGTTVTCEVTPQWKIVSGIAGTSYYKWEVGKTTSGTPPAGVYYVQICAPSNYASYVCDQSDSYFKIYDSDQSGNKPPSISGVSGPTALKIGETGTWTVQASDPENGPLSYSVIWGDEAMVSGGVASAPTMEKIQQTATFTHSYSQAGTYYPKFKVTDNTGQSNSTSISVVVGGTETIGADLSVKSFELNSVGPLIVVCNSGNTYLKNFPFQIHINGVVRDFDFGSAYSNPGQCSGPHQWYYATWGFNAMTSSGYNAKIVLDPYGIYSEVDENNNYAAAFYGSATVNQPPKIVTPSGNPIVSVGETVNIALIASDPDGDRLSMSVDWGDNTGSASSCPTYPLAHTDQLFSNQELKASHLYHVARIYNVMARVIDCRGGEAEQSLQVEVKPVSS